jgi:hypothetical protein
MRYLTAIVVCWSSMYCVSTGAEPLAIPREELNCSIEGPPANAPKAYSHGGVTQIFPNLPNATTRYTGCLHLWLGDGEKTWWVKTSIYFEKGQPTLCVIEDRLQTSLSTKCMYKGRERELVCPPYQTTPPGGWQCPSASELNELRKKGAMNTRMQLTRCSTLTRESSARGLALR